MKLISLKLLHYRRFRQQEINFRDDFLLIFGKNGAGKSSVLDAIGYALFGPGSKDFVRVNRDYLRSFFLSNREPSKIELTFQYGFDTYKIVRVIDAGTKKYSSDFIKENKDSLFGPNQLEILGGDEITNFIQGLIGVNKDTFLRSVFAKQKDLEVLSGGLTERKILINSILGLDKIENIIVDFSRQEREKKLALDLYKKKVSEFDLESLKVQKLKLNEELKDILKNLGLKEEELKKINKNFLEISKNFESEDKKRQDFQNNQNQINSFLKLVENLKIQNQNISQDLEKITQKELYLKENKEIIQQEKSIKETISEQEKNKILFSEFKINKENLERYQNNLKILNQKLKELIKIDLVKKIENLEKELKDLESKKEEIIKIKTGFESKREIVLGQYNELKKELEDIKKLDVKADCPTCKRTLEGYLPKFIKLQEQNINSKLEEGKNIRNEIDKVSIELENVQKDINKQKNDLDLLKQNEKEFIKLTQDKISLEKNIGEISLRLKDIGEIKFDENYFLNLKNDYEKIKKDYLEYLKIEGEVRNKPKLEADFANNLKEIEVNLNQIEKLNQNLKLLNFDEEKYQKLKENYFSINSLIKSKNDEIQIVNSKKMDLDFELKTLEKKENDFLDDKKQIEIYVEEINNFVLKKQIMSDYLNYLLDFLKPRIEDLASEYFSIITDYKYSSISLDENYNIMIDGKNLDLYSGGERDLANLCLRLSLGQNLTSLKGNPINFLILDEVLASQDKDRQQNILMNLKKLETKFSQIILISHLEEIKDFSTSLIEIKALNKEESIVNYY